MPGDRPTVTLGLAPPVATVTLDRPEALNALTAEMLIRLGDIFEELAARADITAVVLTGAGRAFCAGVDLKALGQRRLDGGSVGPLLDDPARRAIHLITTVPQIVVARVNGACFTGALELVLACDLVVADEAAKLGDTHAKWGLRPTWGMSARLWRAVGPSRARELSLTARTFSGREAAEWGIATRAVPAADLDGAVTDLVAAVTANSAGSLVAYKQLYRETTQRGLADALAYEASTGFDIADTEERLAGFRS